MIAWQITETGIIEQITNKEILDDLDNSKIKVTKVFLDKHVYQAYKGLLFANIPCIPGSFSVGIVSECAQDESNEFDKNSRVYVSALKSCDECFECITHNQLQCSNMQFLGRNTNGVLKDFAIAHNNQIFALPNFVSDNDALLLDSLALSITTIDKLDILKGQHVIVIGNGIQALITCQLISYYKSIPVLITNNKTTYELADKLGIFYKFNTFEDLQTEISCLTGGRLAHKIIYFTDSKIDTDYISKLSSGNAKVVLSGFDYYNVNLSVPAIMNKQLDFSCVKNGYGEVKTAINLLATEAIDTSEYVFKEIKFNDVKKYLDSFESEDDFIPCVVNAMI